MTDLDRATEAVLLFHSASPWTLEKAGRWHELTGGQDSATTRSLCDFIRKIRAAHDLPLQPEDWS